MKSQLPTNSLMTCDLGLVTTKALHGNSFVSLCSTKVGDNSKARMDAVMLHKVKESKCSVPFLDLLEQSPISSLTPSSVYNSTKLKVNKI